MNTIFLEDSEDSLQDTLNHKKLVKNNCDIIAKEIENRGIIHDNSKLSGEEKIGYDKITNNLKDLKYGSPEYKKSLNQSKNVIQLHYANNRHHPEHFENGVNNMNLVDIIEMVCDWCASCKRTKNGDILKSLEINKKRFNISDQLFDIIKNTIIEYFH